jgi:hypothetical protein
MIQKLKESSEKVIGFKLSGILTDNEYKGFVAEVETIIADKDKIRLLMIVDYPQDFELKAVWDDMIFWIRHIKDIERLAIVGQKKWEKWLEFLEHPFIKTEVRYYDKSRLQEAWTWLKF